MSENERSISRLNLDTFGDMLKYLRKRAQLTQRELAIAVGYSEAHLSRLERNERLPDLSTLAALFVPALGLEDEPETAAQFLELAAMTRGMDSPSRGNLQIIQSVRAEVAESFPVRHVPSNLPLQLTSFIGRETEIQEGKRLLLGEEKIRLLTMVGAGGCGKTRLALQIAEQLVLDYPHGAWFVDLASLSDPNLIPRVTAAMLGLPEMAAQETIKSLTTFLYPQKALILFDNCEHLLIGVSQLVEAILHACPQVQVIATSREILNIPGERKFYIAPLTVPVEDSSNINAITSFDSVRLFIQRARNIQPDFDLTEENASSVAQVCRRLDGIPLAIELAAARVGFLRVQQIAIQLKDRFKLLTSGSRTLPRHQTLRSMIDWSYELLSDDEQKFFRRLSVFSSTWTLESAEQVANESPQISTLDLLSRLVDKSFIIVEREPGREARYRMLETLREYTQEKLEAVQESIYAREQHFEYFYKLVRQTHLYGPDKLIWLKILDENYDNIRAAVTWAVSHPHNEDPSPYMEETTELVLMITDYFWYRGFIAEAREWMRTLIAAGISNSPLHAFLLQKAGWFARVSGDFKEADTLLYQALKIAYEIGDKGRAAMALMDLGLSLRDQGNREQSLSCFNEALVLAQEGGENRAVGNCMYYLAESNLDDLELSRSLWQQGLEIMQKDGDKIQIGWGMEGLAGVAFLKQEFARARAFHIESLKAKVEVMDKPGIVYSFEGLAQVAAAEEEPERAAVLWGAAHHLREAMSIPSDPSRSHLHTSLIPGTREQIGDKQFDEAWKKGARMELDEMIEFALQWKAGD